MRKVCLRSNGPNEWVSNPVIVPKDNGSIRITVDYRYVNKSLVNSHNPTPRIDDLRASMNGCQYFSKLDMKQAFFQLPISEDTKKFTTFYTNGRLMRLCRLSQGILAASSELNNALRQIFAEISNVYAIHDDLLIATETLEQHYAVVERTLKLIKERGLMLNGPKCEFVLQDIPFWGMRFTNQGIQPCPEKIKALWVMKPPMRKEDVPSFISLLQSHSKFIPL